MAAARKTVRKGAPKRRRSTKKKGNPFGRILLFFTFSFLLGAIAFALLLKDRLLDSGIKRGTIDGVLMAAGVDTDRDKAVVVKDGIERWKITLKSERTKKSVIKGLRHAIETGGGVWQPGDKPWRVNVKTNDGVALRLIFVVGNTAKRPPPKKKTNKKKPPPPKQTLPVAEPEPHYPDDDMGPDFVDLSEEELEEPAVATVPVDDDTLPKLAIILDDIGARKIETLRPVLDLKYPITFAVLPYLRHSAETAIWFHQNRYEVMLHMPMEPENYPKTNPGKGAILSHLSEDQIRASILKAVDAVPFVSGVNNHMGSKITANRALMRPILQELDKKDLYYVDSRTQSNTVAYKLAWSMGLRTARRDVFLDSEISYDFVVKQLREACEIARRNGQAVVIGHPHPVTLKALADELPRIDRQGYRFVFASELVRTADGQL